MQAAFSLAFAIFLRIGEFTYYSKDRQQYDFQKWFLTRRSVRLCDDYLELTLPASKTDPFRGDITLTAAATGDRARAVTAFRHLFKRCPETASSPLFEHRGSFNLDFVISPLRQTLKHMHTEGHYSGHSFRRVAATSAREAGLTEDEIMPLGRWNRRYIVTHHSKVVAMSRRHEMVPRR